MRLSMMYGLTGLVLIGSACLAQEIGPDGGHFKIENPAQPSEAEISQVYDQLLGQMTGGYQLSEQKGAENYPEWQRHNRVPYLSATHGNRYVNNYSNEAAKEYGNFRKGITLPAGAVLAKDSFTITADGKVFAGALFLMEKLQKGANPKTADWRYVMVMPDGSLFGDTTDESATQVAFCHTCHKSKRAFDYLFHVPEQFRVR